MSDSAQGPIISEGASGNINGNDAEGLPMDPDAIDNALFGDGTVAVESPAAVAAPAQSNPEAPAAPAGEPTPQDAPEAAPEATIEPAVVAPEATGPGDKILPNRIATGQFSETTQRAMRLMHELNGGKPEGEGSHTLEACIALVKSADSGQNIVAAPVVAAEPEPAQPSAADILRDEVAALEAQITEAGENQILVGPEFARQVIELGKKQALLAKLEAKSEVQQTTQSQNVVAAREAVMQQVLGEYKGANDVSTLLGARVATLIEEMKNPAHPDHARLSEVTAPRFVVEKAAKQVAANLTQIGMTEAQALATLKTAPAAPAAVPAATPQLVPVAGNKQVTVASGSAGTGGNGSAPTEAEILAAAAANPDDIDNYLGYGSTFRIGG